MMIAKRYTNILICCFTLLVEHKDRLYIFGGFNSNLGTHYNDIYMYNISEYYI